jgi:hypothetical protein
MVSRLFRFLVGVVLFAISSSSWAQIIHWEVDGQLLDPGTQANQERAFSGGFDFDTLSGTIFNVSILSIGTTGQSCFLCFDYSGSTAELFGDSGAIFEKLVDFSATSYRINTLRLLGFDPAQTGTVTGNLSEDYYFVAGTGDPVDDTFINDVCVPSGCITFTGTLVPIPEPETWAMLLAGLGLLGWKGRRTRLDA